MIDEVARAICAAAGTTAADALDLPPSGICVACEKQPDGTLKCMFWRSFRQEARSAIAAVHTVYKRDRRWPNFIRGW